MLGGVERSNEFDGLSARRLGEAPGASAAPRLRAALSARFGGRQTRGEGRAGHQIGSAGDVPDPSPIEPPRPAAAPKPAYRLAIPSVALLLYGALASLWYWGPHSIYFAVLRLFAVNPFRFPFLDISAVLAAAQCRRYGIDVYRRNPCDALGRPHVYSPLWLRITPGFLDTTATTAVGLVLGLLFIASLAPLCRPTTRAEAALLGLTVFSPMIVYALERANSDLVVFLLIFAGCAVARVSRPWRWGAYALYFFAGLLKYYPLALLALVIRESRRAAIALAATAAAVLLVLVLCDRAELAKALANIPRLAYFADSFAAVNLPFGLAEVLLDPVLTRLVGITLLAVLTALAGARTRRTLSLLDRASPDWRPFEVECLIVGAVVLAGCFLVGQNVDYRGIYLVLVTPGLLVLRRSASAVEVRRFLARMIGAVVFVAWEEVIRGIFGAAASALPNVLRPRAETLFWLGRELVWWWLVAGFAAIVLCHMRQLPLVADTGAILARLGRTRRRSRFA